MCCKYWDYRIGNISLFQVGFNIDLDTIQNPDSEFPTAVSKTLEGMQASFQNPFWMFNISTFPFQNSTIKAIKFLRSFATEVIKERCLALKNGAETPKDVLEHILKEANINPDLDMEDLVDNFLTVFIAGIERLVLMSVLMIIFYFILIACDFAARMQSSNLH